MRRLTSLFMLTALIATPALARQTPTPPVDAPAPVVAQATTPPATAPRPGQTAPPRVPTPQTGLAALPQMPATTNVKLDMTITDTFTGTPVTKTVSLIVLTGNSGRIRTSNFVSSGIETILNVDASTTAYQNNLVRVSVTFEYTPAEGRTSEGRPLTPAPKLNESITVMLQDGKPMIVSQSADPITDRKVTVELTASILK